MSIRSIMKAASFKAFLLGDRFGVHVLPKHYYAPVPDVTWLKRNRSLWSRPVNLDHIQWNLEGQAEWLQQMSSPYYGEVQGLSVYDEATARVAGAGFEPIDSQVLHCFLRHHRPRRIVEIGSGVSTVCMLNAGRRNQEEGEVMPDITCIDPKPSRVLSQEPAVRLLEMPAQAVDPGVFDQLKDGDLLFVDSTHTVKTGSEVPRIYLDVIPKLSPGVFVHAHDIYLPYVYPRHVLDAYLDWQESTLLLALLTHNRRLRAVCCMSALHYALPDTLRSLLTDYAPQANDEGIGPLGDSRHFPTSIYLRTT